MLGCYCGSCIRMCLNMATTTAAYQLKLEEMEFACSLLFAKGFVIAVLTRTIERERERAFERAT